MNLTGGELTALTELHSERREYEYLLAARLALFCRQTIWSQQSLTEYDVLGWDLPDSPVPVDTETAEFDALCDQLMRAEVTGH